MIPLATKDLFPGTKQCYRADIFGVSVWQLSRWENGRMEIKMSDLKIIYNRYIEAIESGDCHFPRYEIADFIPDLFL